MRRAVKVKIAAPMPLRKTGRGVAPTSRRPFPAWISADEPGVVFSAKAATPRVRDGLVLRTVSKKKAGAKKTSSHGPGPR